jgi:DNA-binding CsgD family transcriptional regulator
MTDKKTLTKRELEIVKLIIADKSTIEIAQTLNISPNTIVSHRKNILRKLNIKTAVGLFRWAIINEVEYVA